MVPVEYIIALSMSIVEIVRKSKPEIKSYSPLIALAISLVLGILNADLGGQDFVSSLTDNLVKSCIAFGLFAGGTLAGTKINSLK